VVLVRIFSITPSVSLAEAGQFWGVTGAMADAKRALKALRFLNFNERIKTNY
jgi:hypothetical protein